MEARDGHPVDPQEEGHRNRRSRCDPGAAIRHDERHGWTAGSGTAAAVDAIAGDDTTVVPRHEGADVEREVDHHTNDAAAVHGANAGG